MAVCPQVPWLRPTLFLVRNFFGTEQWWGILVFFCMQTLFCWLSRWRASLSLPPSSLIHTTKTDSLIAAATQVNESTGRVLSPGSYTYLWSKLLSQGGVSAVTCNIWLWAEDRLLKLGLLWQATHAAVSWQPPPTCSPCMPARDGRGNAGCSPARRLWEGWSRSWCHGGWRLGCAGRTGLSGQTGRRSLSAPRSSWNTKVEKRAEH